MAEPKGRRVPATEFKQRCLALVEQVARTRVPLTVTKHGRPVVTVVPVEAGAGDMMGSVSLVAGDPEAYMSTGERWDADREA